MISSKMNLLATALAMTASMGLATDSYDGGFRSPSSRRNSLNDTYPDPDPATSMANLQRNEDNLRRALEKRQRKQQRQLEIADRLKLKNLSSVCQSDVLYLRTRNRHTVELEDQLIALHTSGVYPNMNEFGVTQQTQENLLAHAIRDIKE